jgi:ribosome-associated heat shock protein Hsp15
MPLFGCHWLNSSRWFARFPHNPFSRQPMEKIRIDKWLWAARFYKTRTLASEEIDKGRVHLNGVAVKPAREVKAGDLLQVRNGGLTRTMTVLGVSDKRGSATIAALLFTETPASIAQRAATAELRRLAPEPALSLMQGRPTKRERRETDQARQWGDRWSASIDT